MSNVNNITIYILIKYILLIYEIVIKNLLIDLNKINVRYMYRTWKLFLKIGRIFINLTWYVYGITIIKTKYKNVKTWFVRVVIIPFLEHRTYNFIATIIFTTFSFVNK